MIYIVKTSIGQEKNVADMIHNKQHEEDEIISILATPRLRGYLFVEAGDELKLRNILRNIPHTRGLVKGGGKSTIQVGEISHLLVPKPKTAQLNLGDLIEIAEGPFKGEKAKIQHIDENKEEITVELIEAMVPIPITIKADAVRIIEKGE